MKNEIKIFDKNVYLSEKGSNGIEEQDIIAFIHNTINSLDKHDDNLIYYFDIGANFGHFSVVPTLLNENIRCFSFEPNPNNFEILNENIALNNINNVSYTYNIGVSSNIGMFDLKIPLDLSDHGLSTFAENPKERFAYDGKPGEYQIKSIQCKSLDSIFLQLEISRIDFIKIDTEGSELNVLKGAEGVLRRFKPPIVMEYQNVNTNMFGYDREEIIALLQIYGYNSFTLVPGRDSDLFAKYDKTI
jgi:FkbM family methyltransferase